MPTKAQLEAKVKQIEADLAIANRSIEVLQGDLVDVAAAEAKIPYCVELVTRDGARQVQMRVKNERVIELIRRVWGSELYYHPGHINCTWEHIELRVVLQN